MQILYPHQRDTFNLRSSRGEMNASARSDMDLDWHGMIHLLNEFEKRIGIIDDSDPNTLDYRISAIERGSSGGSISGFTVGSIIFAGAGGILSEDNASLFWDDGSNRLGLLTTTPATTLDNYGTSTFRGATTFRGEFSPELISIGAQGFIVTNYSSGVGGGMQNVFRRADGTEGSPTNVKLNMGLGSFSFRGYTGSGWTGSKAYISVGSAEDWDPSANGTYITFQTTAIGTTTLAERMRISSEGFIGIGTSPAWPFDFVTTRTDTSAGSKYGASYLTHLNPSGASSSAFYGVVAETRPTGANSFTDINSAFYFNRWNGSSGATNIRGLYASAFYGSTSTGFGTITNAVGAYIRAVDHFTNNPTGTITSATGGWIRDNARGGSNLAITYSRGLVVENQSLGASSNVTLQIGTSTNVSSGNYAIYESHTITDETAGGKSANQFYMYFTPANNCNASNVAINFSPSMEIRGANTIANVRLVNASNALGSTFSSSITTVEALRFNALTSSSNTNFGTISNVYGIYLLPVYFTGTQTGTITTATGFYVVNSTIGSATLTNLRGMHIVEQTSGTNNTLILLGNSSATGNWSLYNSSGYSSYFATGIRIGTSSTPLRELDITKSSANAGIRIQSSGGSGKTWAIVSTTSGNLDIQDDSDSDPLFRMESDGDFLFYTGGATRFFINSSAGNIIIGGNTFGTSLASGLVWNAGTAPTASHPSNAIQAWIADRNAVDVTAGLNLRAESGRLYILADRAGFGTLTPAYDFDLVGDAQISGDIIQDDVVRPYITVGGSDTSRTFTVSIDKFNNTAGVNTRFLVHYWVSTSSYGSPGTVASQTYTITTGTNFGAVSTTTINTAFTNSSGDIVLTVSNGQSGVPQSVHFHIEVQGILYTASGTVFTGIS